MYFGCIFLVNVARLQCNQEVSDPLCEVACLLGTVTGRGLSFWTVHYKLAQEDPFLQFFFVFFSIKAFQNLTIYTRFCDRHGTVKLDI